jgi:ABC-type glutathione transport system ATPase component
VKDLKVHFPVKKGVFRRTVGHIKAVDGVSFDLHEGRTLALVGESGCGKTTTGKALLRLIEPTSGSVSFDQEQITALGRGAMRPLRPRRVRGNRLRAGVQIGPQVTDLRDPLGHAAQRQGARMHRALLDLLPGARRGNGRAWLCPHSIGGRESRAVTVASSIDKDAAGAINLHELLCQLFRIAFDEDFSHDVREARHGTEI